MEEGVQRIRAMQNTRHFKVMIYSLLVGRRVQIMDIRARRAQILGIYRLVIRFRHSLSYSHQSQKMCETQHSTHRQVGKVFRVEQEEPVLGSRKTGSQAWSCFCTWSIFKKI